MARVLVIIPYRSLFPPRGGGLLRAFHLLRELAREHEVHAVMLQPESELSQEREGYKFPASVRVYSPSQMLPPRTVFDLLPAKLSKALKFRWLQHSWRGPADGNLLQTYHLISHVLNTQQIDAVLFTALNSLSTARFVKRLAPNVIRIANLENVDHRLLAQQIEQLQTSVDQGEENSARQSRQSLQRNYEKTRQIETSLTQIVDAFFACSDEDREALSLLNGQQIPGFTVANGVDTKIRKFDGRADKSASHEVLFCGSLNYHPNRDGLTWFHEKIWPLVLARLPDVRLVVIGRGAKSNDFYSLRVDPSVDFIGEVGDVNPYYHRTGVVIVPLRTGSGTRLKILEAMSLGNPIVSTQVGAEGIGVVNERHILLADKPEVFAAAVQRLLSDAKAFETIRYAARHLVEKTYDWQIVGQKMDQVIATLLREHQSNQLISQKVTSK